MAKFHSQGVTLIELLVTMAIVAFLALAVSPSVGTSIANARARTVAHQFVSDMAWVRNQAAGTSITAANAFPTLTLNADCSWAPANVNAGAIPTHSITAAYLAASVAGFSCNVPNAPINFVFNSQGFVTPSVVLSFSGPSNTSTWNVRVLSSGTALITNGVQ